MKTVVQPNRPARRTPSGFTLVELLTVIVIIGILAGLTTGAGIMVRNRVRQSIVQADLKQMDMALQEYKNTYGEFPPDFAWVSDGGTQGTAARARVVRHLRKAFPRLDLTGANTDAQFNDFLGRIGCVAADLTPATALTFWLGGIEDSNGKPSGFHTDPANPFKTGSPRTQPLFDFNPDRLVGTSYQYVPKSVQPATPYVYFRAVKSTDTGLYEYAHYNSTATPDHELPFVNLGADSGVVVPYLQTAGNYPPTYAAGETRKWPNPDTYQILSAGLDGVYGAAGYRFTDDAQGFTDGDYDNLANFIDGRLEDEIE